MMNKDFKMSDRIIGKAAAFSLLILGIIYAVVLILGLISLETKMDPIGNPYVSIMEIIIILMAPLMVVLMVEVHTYASGNTKTLSLIALVFMIITACITSSVHFVLLTVGLQTDFTTDLQWLQQLMFSWKWPSVVYALDILAWDLFFSLSMLFAAPVFKGNRLEASVRITMIASGLLSLAGLIGPIIADMQIRMIGVVGYTVFFPLACLLLSKLFSQSAIKCTVKYS